jgi:nucleoside-diphosphate-sugar epimerase
MSVVLVTGASGFIGTNLIRTLKKDALTVAPCSRQKTTDPNWREYPVRDIDGWISVLDGVDVVVHLAGIAPQLASY